MITGIAIRANATTIVEFKVVLNLVPLSGASLFPVAILLVLSIEIKGQRKHTARYRTNGAPMPEKMYG
jgi:hypothetical protein